MSPLLLEFPRDLSRAAAIIMQGGVVAYPTETFYGLAVHPMKESAMDAVYEAKNRPESLPLPLIVDHPSSIAQVAGGIPPMVQEISRHGWPSGLTVVLSALPTLPERIRHRGTVALRVSPHPAARALARLAGGVITSTSANLSGQPPVRDPMQLLDLPVDAILNGGPTPGGLPSTIIAPPESEKDGFEILRQGSWQPGNPPHLPEIPDTWTKDLIPDVDAYTYQPPEGYRFNADSILLAREAQTTGLDGQRILDLGAGTGAVTIHMALGSSPRRIDAVEIDGDAVDAMTRALAEQGLLDRVDPIAGDAADIRNLIPGGIYDTVVLNPPYFRPDRGRTSPRRSVASHSGSLEPFIAAAARSLKNSGILVVIIPPERLQELLHLGLENRLELKKMVLYSGTADGPVRRMVVHLKKGRVQRPETVGPTVIHI